MSDQDDFQSRVDALKAEADREVERDRQRRRWIGGGFLDELAVGAMFWILGFAALVGAVAIGLGVGIKTALAITVFAIIAALAVSAMTS